MCKSPKLGKLGTFAFYSLPKIIILQIQQSQLLAKHQFVFYSIAILFIRYYFEKKIAPNLGKLVKSAFYSFRTLQRIKELRI